MVARAAVVNLLCLALFNIKTHHLANSERKRESFKIPGKHSDTRIKPLPLTNGHGRYITVTTERTLVSVGECPLHITVINL